MFKIFQRFCSTSKHWSLERLTETNMLSITNLQAEQKYHYPFVWLRDNCQCPQCFNATSKSRIMDLKTNLKVKPIDIDIQRAFDRVSNDLEKSTDVTGESGTGNVGSNDVKSGDFNLNIRWEDNHRSEFPLDWLIARNFTAANRVRLDEIYRIPRIPWTSEQFPEICSKFAFEDLMTDGRALLAWMECLATYGVAIVDRAGVEMGALNRLASRVGFLKRTQYGETFRVENKPGLWVLRVFVYFRNWIYICQLLAITQVTIGAARRGGSMGKELCYKLQNLQGSFFMAGVHRLDNYSGRNPFENWSRYEIK